MTSAAVLGSSEFYNDAVNEDIDVQEDFRRSRTSSHFSFWRRPYLLDAASKAQFLQLDAYVQMDQNIRHSMLSNPFAMFGLGGLGSSPYLVVEVRRSHIVQDALGVLQAQQSVDLKKPLKVKFAGEEGIDAGGVKKEFFQLVRNTTNVL